MDILESLTTENAMLAIQVQELEEKVTLLIGQINTIEAEFDEEMAEIEERCSKYQDLVYDIAALVEQV